MEPQVSNSRFRRFMSRIFPKGRSRTEYTEKPETKAPLQEQRCIRLFSRKPNKELSRDGSGSSSADTLSDWEMIEDTHPRRLGSRPNNSKTRLPSSHRSQSGRRAEYYNYTLSSSSLARRDSDKENRIGRRLPS
ncbi:hypothetical protein ACGC1H_000995 [Rhizoctonia solani]|uniref:Uncharacterized protein n=1 Tax=Rhizoctonia solani TaxID=456999 RepID=A0A8H3GSY0_9AGAM|nr:unnamed protein product [Rhizoctonia solani]